jgi:hypothetical protein
VHLWLRILYVFIVARFRQPLELGKSRYGLRLFAMPTDIDLKGQVNNGRYLTSFDLTSRDVFLRTGLFFHARANRWFSHFPLRGLHARHSPNRTRNF